MESLRLRYRKATCIVAALSLITGTAGCDGETGPRELPTPSIEKSFSVARLPLPPNPAHFEATQTRYDGARNIDLRVVVDRIYLSVLKEKGRIKSRFSPVSNPLLQYGFFDKFNLSNRLGSFTEATGSLHPLTRLIVVGERPGGRIDLFMRVTYGRRYE